MQIVSGLEDTVRELATCIKDKNTNDKAVTTLCQIMMKETDKLIKVNTRFLSIKFCNNDYMNLALYL